MKHCVRCKQPFGDFRKNCPHCGVRLRQLKIRNTSEILITPTFMAYFHDQFDRVGEHLLFRFPGYGLSNVTVTLINGAKALCSVRRLAWLFAHPGENITEDEKIIVTCGRYGELHTDNRVCCNPEHLRKVPAYGPAPKPVVRQSLGAPLLVKRSHEAQV